MGLFVIDFHYTLCIAWVLRSGIPMGMQSYI